MHYSLIGLALSFRVQVRRPSLSTMTVSLDDGIRLLYFCAASLESVYGLHEQNSLIRTR
jgi:hypothetical protein